MRLFLAYEGEINVLILIEKSDENTIKLMLMPQNMSYPKYSDFNYLFYCLKIV